MRKALLAVLAMAAPAMSILLAACAARGPSYGDVSTSSAPVAANQSRVVMLRRKDRYDDYSSSKARIRINAQDAGQLAYGGFFFIDVVPGTVSLLASARNSAFGTCELQVPAVAGGTIYVDVAPRTEHIVAGLAGSMAASSAVANASDGASTLPEAMITEPAKEGVAGAAGGAAAQMAESSGKRCGGPFALIPLVPADALRYLDTLAWSK